MLAYGFMQHALVAAALVGLTAPTVGLYLVQRRLSLFGDGIGHVALLGVAVGLVTASAPVPAALVTAAAGAVAVELLRSRRSAGADVALALLIYGGVAGAVVVVALVPAGRPANLDAYLFGALLGTSRADLVLLAGMAAGVLAVTLGLHRYLVAAALDHVYARARGVPVLRLDLLLAVVAAVTVVLSMRVIGLLLISGLMVLPAACAQLVARSLRGGLLLAMAVGLTVSVGGTVLSYSVGTPPGATIVLLAVAVFALLSLVRAAGVPATGRSESPLTSLALPAQAPAAPPGPRATLRS